MSEFRDQDTERDKKTVIRNLLALEAMLAVELCVKPCFLDARANQLLLRRALACREGESVIRRLLSLIGDGGEVPVVNLPELDKWQEQAEAALGLVE